MFESRNKANSGNQGSISKVNFISSLSPPNSINFSHSPILFLNLQSLNSYYHHSNGKYSPKIIKILKYLLHTYTCQAYYKLRTVYRVIEQNKYNFCPCRYRN